MPTAVLHLGPTGAVLIVLVHAAPATLAPYRTRHLGVLSSPRRFYRDVAGWPWAADNDAFSAWDEGRYRRMLDGIADMAGCLFVTAPDVVGDAAATMQLFHEWVGDLRELVHPIALVAQDGLEDPPWDMFNALFIGGTDVFKMGDDAARLVLEARRRGKWVHMGRINGHRRLMHAKALGCDSMDGTSLSWFRDRWLPGFLEHAGRPSSQLRLGDAA